MSELELTDVSVRRLQHDDHDAVMALAPRLTEGVAPWRDPVAVRRAVEDWVERSLESAERDGHAVFVADVAGEVVGFVSVGEREHFSDAVDGYVGELVVSADQVGQGIGDVLMTAAEDWARDRGLQHLTLETGAANTVARRFYAARGYREEDVRLTRPL